MLRYSLLRLHRLAHGRLANIFTALPNASMQKRNNHQNLTWETDSEKAEKKTEQYSDFGFRQVKKEAKEDLVQDVFTNVADKYDMMNDLMSCGIHRVWKDELVSLIDPPVQFGDSQQNLKELDGFSILDVAGGTGDTAFRILEKVRTKIKTGQHKCVRLPSILVCDLNKDMLRIGEEKAAKQNIQELSWKVCNGEALPFTDSFADIVTIAFGIRNFTNVQQGLREAFRVLKPGGRFLCLEFSKVENPLLSVLYDAYSFNVIPLMGRLVVNDGTSYQYLVESIRRFPDQKSFCKMCQDAGFQHVTYSNLTGGVAAIHSGFKLHC